MLLKNYPLCEDYEGTSNFVPESPLADLGVLTHPVLHLRLLKATPWLPSVKRGGEPGAHRLSQVKTKGEEFKAILGCLSLKIGGLNTTPAPRDHLRSTYHSLGLEGTETVQPRWQGPEA